MTDKENNKEESRRKYIYEFNGVSRDIYLDMPSASDIKKSEWHYSSVYNKALVEGIATSGEVEEILIKRGVLGPEFERQVEDAKIELTLTLAAMNQADEPHKKRELAIKAEKLRENVYRLNSKVSGPVGNSCEGMARDAKIEFLTSCMVKNEDGTRIWNSYDEFLEDPDMNFCLFCRVRTMFYMEGLDEDFMNSTPEALVLKSLNRELQESSQKVLEEPKTKTKVSVNKRQHKAVKAEG